MLRQASGALRRAVTSRRQASTLILADHDGGNMTPSTLAALTAASKLNETSAVLVAGAPSTVAEQAAKAQGVEAVFHFGSYFDTFIANSLSQSPPEATDPLPADYAEYAEYAAQKLAEGYYGGVPVVTVTPTKENALAGKIFGCSP